MDKCAQRVENKLNKYHLLPSAMQDQPYVLTMPSQIVHSIFFFPKINISMYSAEICRDLKGVGFFFFCKAGGHGSLEMINNSESNYKT